ncbi:hypothetical protein B0H34DRAFT_675818 [Crassisporium funariophilum]|nr:hypothetical protein B0H34DRAFT_675818 [Crassisporium funariophilum]
MAHVISDVAPSNPYVPSDVESKFYYYGLPSLPRLAARSSWDVWKRPTGPEAYLIPKELEPLGTHLLQGVWEDTVGPAMESYMQEKGVKCTSMTPLRVVVEGQASSNAVVLIGVHPGSLSPDIGIEVAVHCRSILLNNGIGDVHVEIRDSRSTLAASLYRPAVSSNPAAHLREPFSTSLGVPICNAKTTNIEGTGGLFFTDSTKPGALFMLTARHVLLHPDTEENKLYEFKIGTGAPRRDVMLLGEAAFKSRVEDIEAAISGKNLMLQHLQKRLALAEEIEDEDDSTAERDAVESKMKEANAAISAFEKFLADVDRDWKKESNRVIGHIIFSPPISVNVGKDGYTDDWAVVEILPTTISKINFVGNVIDLRSIDFGELNSWMYTRPTRPAHPNFFEYPGNSLLRCRDMVSDQEMLESSAETRDQDDGPVIMVMKNGNTSKLTVGRLNTIRSFVRYYFDGKPGEMSKEIAVLPRRSKPGSLCINGQKPGPFSAPGDSGSVVVDGVGRICGILTGGDGATDEFDCTFLTSINFLVDRLNEHGFRPNFFPLPADL